MKIATYSGSVADPYKGAARAAASSKDGSAGSKAPLEAASVEPWVLEQLSLAAFAGQASVLVRFRVKTDASVVEDGWYVDDIAIDDLPAAVNLDPVSGASKASLDLSWSSGDATDFARYEVYRSDSPGVSFNDALVATLTGPNSGSYTDTGLPGKSTFYYKVFVVSTSDIYSGSNEVSGTTLPGIDYPFSDNMEASGNNWSPEPSRSWTWVTPASAHSGTKAWTDSPGEDYATDVDASLVLADAISVKTGSQLVFWHLLDIRAGDVASVELSTDNGSTWSELVSYTDMTVDTWTQVQVGLGTESALGRVRFRIVTNGADGARGWTIDDVSISDLPTAVTLEAVVPQPPPNEDEIRLVLSQPNCWQDRDGEA